MWDSGFQIEDISTLAGADRHEVSLVMLTVNVGSFAPGFSELAGSKADFMPGDLAILAQDQGSTS